jgi:hypothetical protein
MNYNAMEKIKQKLFILILTQVITLPVFSTLQLSSELNKPEAEFTADTLRNDTIIVYTCPMHPEILSNKPGNCPKCGMELVKKSSSANNNHDGQHKMGMMSMPMGDMNHPKEKPSTNKMVIAMGAIMGVMMVVMLVFVAGH